MFSVSIDIKFVIFNYYKSLQYYIILLMIITSIFAVLYEWYKEIEMKRAVIETSRVKGGRCKTFHVFISLSNAFRNSCVEWYFRT